MEDYSMYEPTNLLYTQENLSRYQPGGYHPVCLGDRLHGGQYTIRHKLGWGGFSTVWLARDTKNNQWVSIKIMTADSGSKSQELLNLQDLASHAKGDLASKFIVQLLDEFQLEGPNGTHQCLVFELLGPSVDQVLREYHEYRDDGEPLEPNVILRMCEQLLEAVVFIHGAGFSHGDISSRKIAFKCGVAERLSEEEFFEIIGTPETDEVARIDALPLPKSMPSQLVKAAAWDTWVNEDEEDLRLIDFGETFKKGAEPEKIAQPGSLRAPETVFTDKFDYRLDLWRVGIAIHSFVLQTYPFHYLGGDDALATAMVGFVEKLPTEWEPKFQELLLNAKHEIGNSEDSAQDTQCGLEITFEKKVTEESLKSLLPVIQGLMRFKPEDRISALQALELVRAIERQRDESEDSS